MNTKKNRNFIIIVLLSVAFYACNNAYKSNDEVPTIHIDPNIEERPCLASEILTDMSIVNLETHENSLLGRSTQLMYMGDKNIVVRSDNQIIIFDNQGRYINKINAVGKGPEEYSLIWHTFFNPVKEYIYIVDFSKKVQVYGIDSHFINSLSPTFNPNGIYCKNNGEMILSYFQSYDQDNRDMLSLLDSTFNIYHTFKSKNPDVIKDVQQDMSSGSIRYEIGDKMYYCEDYTDTIYEINDTILMPHWVMDRGGKSLKTREGMNVQNFIKANDKLKPFGLYETEKYFFVQYFYQNAQYFSIYDKNAQAYLFHQKDSSEGTAPGYGVQNDLITNGPSYWPTYAFGHKVVSLVYPSSLSEDQCKQFNCKPDDNPLLFIGQLK